MPRALENRGIVVVLAKVDARNAEVRKSDLVPGNELLSMTLKSSIQQISQLLPRASPLWISLWSAFSLGWTGDGSEDRIILNEIHDGIDFPLLFRISGVVPKFDCDCACCCLGLVDFDTLNGDLWEGAECLLWFQGGPLFEADIVPAPIGAGVDAHHSDKFSTTVHSKVVDVDAVFVC